MKHKQCRLIQCISATLSGIVSILTFSMFVFFNNFFSLKFFLTKCDFFNLCNTITNGITEISQTPFWEITFPEKFYLLLKMCLFSYAIVADPPIILFFSTGCNSTNQQKKEKQHEVVRFSLEFCNIRCYNTLV